MSCYTNDKDKHWWGAKIPYKIANNVVNQNRLLDAIDEWNNNTVARLVPRENEDDFIRFVNTNDNKGVDMFDFLLSDEIIKIRDEARDLVKSVPRQMLIDMDNDKIQFPKEFLQEAGRRNLMGCRYPAEWGGRGLDWVATSVVMEEIGVLGYIVACVFPLS